MPFKKRHIFNLLFLVCFSFYIITPFCYVGNQAYADDAIAFKAKTDINRISVVWELMLSSYLTHNDDENSRPNVKLLIRKARALINSNNIIKLTPSESAEIDYNGIIFSIDSDTSFFQHTNPEYLSGAYRSVSGLSPPAIS